MDRANGTGGKLASGLGFAGLVSFDGISLAWLPPFVKPPDLKGFGTGRERGAPPLWGQALQATSDRCE